MTLRLQRRKETGEAQKGHVMKVGLKLERYEVGVKRLEGIGRRYEKHGCVLRRSRRANVDQEDVDIMRMLHTRGVVKFKVPNIKDHV